MTPFSINLHRLRNGEPGRDKAILDLLQLQQPGMAPGRARLCTLMQLWGVSQPQVSRRMNAIRELGPLWVEAGGGTYRLIDRHEERRSRDRWEAMRQKLREVMA